MNKLLAAVLISAAAPLAFIANPAMAEEHTGFFIDGRLGTASTNDNGIDDNTFGGSISGGYRWGYWGVELGYANFDGFKDNGAQMDVDGFTAGVNARFNVADQWYVSARGGAFVWDAEIDSGSIRGRADGTKFYAGLGFGYDFSESFSAGVAYDHYNIDNVGDADIGLISANAEVRF